MIPYRTVPLPPFLAVLWLACSGSTASEKVSRVPYDAQGTPAHLGVDQKESGCLPLLNLVSDSANPHCVLGPLPQ